MLNRILTIFSIAAFLLAGALFGVTIKSYLDYKKGLESGRPKAVTSLPAAIKGRKPEKIKIEGAIKKIDTESIKARAAERAKRRKKEEEPKVLDIRLKADGEVPGKAACVFYVIPSLSGKDILFTADFTARNLEAGCKATVLRIRNVTEPGEYPLYIKTREGAVIEATFLYQNYLSPQVRIDTDPQPDGAQQLTVESKAGHIINFELVWLDGAIEAINIIPAVHPYIDFGTTNQ